jgi:ethanolamine utilization protein
MDKNQLVDEILARVAAKLAGLESGEPSANQRKVLILTEHHDTLCHELLENKGMQSCCRLDCAFLKEYNVKIEDYDMAVIYQLSVDALGKLAGGICDSPFLHLASQAILLGKRVLVVEDEIELHRYKQTAPEAYYSMLEEKLNQLRSFGVLFCRYEDLEPVLSDRSRCNERSPEEAEYIRKEAAGLSKKSEQNEGKQKLRIDKKVITESDIRKLAGDNIGCICINKNAILTDLAKDYLHNRKIGIEREASAERKQG